MNISIRTDKTKNFYYCQVCGKIENVPITIGNWVEKEVQIDFPFKKHFCQITKKEKKNLTNTDCLVLGHLWLKVLDLQTT